MSTNLFEANRQWATRPADQRFATLADLSASVKNRRARSRSGDIDIQNIKAHVTPEGDISFNNKITPVKPTHWSFGQFSSLIKAPAAYLRTLPTPMVVDLFNHGIQNADREKVKAMTITSEDENSEYNTLQAMTSTRYGRIWDADVVDCADRIIESTGGKFRNPVAYTTPGQLGGPLGPAGLYASDRDVFMFFIDGGDMLDMGGRDQLHRGFFMWNSEVGDKTFGIQTFLFRATCGNNIVWGAQDINRLVIRHSSGGPQRFDSEALPHLLQYVRESDEGFRSKIDKARDVLLPTDNDELIAFANKAAKFTRTEISSAIHTAKAEEGDCRTVWHLINGLTAYARGFDFADTRIDLEKRAGKLIDLVN